MRFTCLACILVSIASQDLFLDFSSLTPPRSKCVFENDCWPSSQDLRGLGASIQGDVVLREDKLWRSATKLKNKRLDTVIVPGAAVMAETADDVVVAMKFAVTHNLELSIKSSGHCYSGNCMKTGSLHIDLTRMGALKLDTDAMELYVQPGTNFTAMYKLCDDHGVLVVGGMCPTVGPVGFNLGGGHGPLIRSYGVGADNMLSVDLVSASGELLTASADHNSELFQALRGGGGGAFGVVVGMKLRVHRAPVQMVGVSCAWPLSHRGKRVGEPILAEWYQSVMPNLPDPWTTYTVAMKMPLGPKVPGWNPLTMNGLLIVEGLYNGAYSQSMLDSIDGLLKLGKVDQLKCSFTNYTSFRKWHDASWFADEGPIPFRTYMAGSLAQPDFDRTALAKLVTDTVLALPLNAINMMFAVQLGGKISRPDSKTSMSTDFRNAVLFQENDADWNLELADKQQISWAQSVGDSVAAVKGFSGAYMNEVDPAIPLGRYEELFWGKQNFATLQGVKRKWDPQAVFDCHQCVHN